jgi:hypothetical protein
VIDVNGALARELLLGCLTAGRFCDTLAAISAIVACA